MDNPGSLSPNTANGAAPAGRVSIAPQGGLGTIIGLVVVALLVLMSSSTLIAAYVWFSGDTALGLKLIGYPVFVISAICFLAFVIILLRVHRNQLAEEICWCPIVPGQTCTMDFTARQARFHGLWLNVELSYRVGGGPHYVISTVVVTADGETIYDGPIGLCWAYSSDGGTRGSLMRTQYSHKLGIPLSVMELDRSHYAWDTGQYSTRALLLRIRDLREGQRVSLNLTVEPPPVVTKIRAHAAVALPP